MSRSREGTVGPDCVVWYALTKHNRRSRRSKLVMYKKSIRRFRSFLLFFATVQSNTNLSQFCKRCLCGIR